MRWSSIVTVLCCTIALILSLLTFFAGNTRTFLQNGDLLTLNMSRLGYSTGSIFNTTDSDGSFLDNLLNDGEATANSLLNSATTEIASQLNLSDFYSVHLQNYCKGSYTPNGTVAAENGTHVTKNTTYCSPTNTLFHFNITQIVQDALPDKISLTEISWPSAITSAEHTLRLASIATAILYILALTFTGLALLASIFSLFTSGRLSACLNLLLDLLAFTALTAASIVATVVIVKAVDALNKYGDDLGISATKGRLFLGMSWASAALMLVAAGVSMVQVVRGRKQERYVSEIKANY